MRVTDGLPILLDGYDLDGAKRFLERAGGLKLAFVEELFDEQVEQCLELKRFMSGHGCQTLLADGDPRTSSITGRLPLRSVRSPDRSSAGVSPSGGGEFNLFTRSGCNRPGVPPKKSY